MTKQETLPKAVGVQNVTSPKHLVINQILLRVRVLQIASIIG